MKSLTFHGPRAIHLESVPDPELVTARDAIVKVDLTAICGSDLHVYHGRETGLDPGTVMGHEFVGEVVETGAEVRRLRAGDRVVSPFTTSCGECFYCRVGLTARCTKGRLFGWVEGGRGLEGAQAEYVRVPLADATLVAMPEGAPAEEVLLAGDVLSTGYFCAEAAAVRPRARVAVVGCGPVGLMAIVAARELGAEGVHAFDRVPERLRLAERFGAIAIHAGEHDPVANVREATGGRGADAVLEAVGTPEAMRLAYDLVRPGGTIAAAGVHTEAHFAFAPGEAYDKNLTYIAGRCPARRYLGRVLEIVASRKYELGAIVSHRLPLEDGPRGYDIFDRKLDGCTKVILAP